MEKDRRKFDIEKIKYESIFKFFNNALILFDPVEDCIIDVNDKACKLFKCDNKEIKEYNLVIYKKVKEYLSDKNNSIFNEELSLFIKDQEEIIASVKGMNITVQNKQYILFNIKDITKEKKLNLKLRRNEEFIHSIINVIPDDLNIINTDGIIIWSNNKKIIGQNLCSTFHESHCEVCGNSKDNCYIDKVFKTGKNIEFETKHDDKYYWHTVTPCNKNGHVNSVLEIRRDVTERKKVIELDEIRSLVDKIVNNTLTINKKINGNDNEPT